MTRREGRLPLGGAGAAALGAALLIQACSLMPQPGETAAPPGVKPAAVIPSEQEPLGSVDVKAAQRALLELGYYEAGVDGIVGPKTKAAVRAFQKARNLQITGDLTRELVQTIVNSAAGSRQRMSSFTGLAQPVYEIGDRFYYSDGSSETVLSAEEGRVVWESSDGTRRTAPWNFLLPAVAWYGEHGSGSAEAEAAPDLLWPLKPGSEARFSVSASTMGSGASAEEIFELWHCKVRSSTRITVPAGTFDTIPILCTVFRQPSGPKRTVVWNYAPAVGHFVRRSEAVAEQQEKSMELLAVELGGEDWPAAARAGLDWAMQHALENGSSGQAVEWESSALPGHIEIEALAELDYSGAATCRRFAATRFNADGMKRIYPGVACRSADGIWAVPGEQDRASAELP
jgi:peptidoglycan hydrolase-like protein with peptidoglycan-binding domain/surface antigen